MYNAEYEEAIIAYLRILKYVHTYRPETFKLLCGDKISPEDYDLYVTLYDAHFALADEIYSEYDDNEGVEITVISDRSFSDFIRLSCQLYGDDLDAARKHFEDTAAFFLSDRCAGINDAAFRFHMDSAEIRLFFFQGCTDMEDYIFMLTDLLLYFQRADEAMREQLRAMETNNILPLPQDTGEEAA